MWMETILLRGTLESTTLASQELSTLIGSIQADEPDLDMLNVYRRDPEFGDLLVEIRWRSDEAPFVTRLGGAVSRILEKHGSIYRSTWNLNKSLSFRVLKSTENAPGEEQ